MSKKSDHPKATRPPRPTAIATASWSSSGIIHREATVAEQEAAFDPYAQELGRLVYAWNRLHVHLADLFHVTSEIKSRDVANAIWHTLASDRAQMGLLEAAATRFEEGTFMKEEILWLLDKINQGHSGKRNAAIHGPLNIEARIPDGQEVEIIISPDVYSGSAYAKQLAENPDLLFELKRCRAYTDSLSKHAKELAGYIRWRGWENNSPFPDRPVPPPTTPPAKKGETPHTPIAPSPPPRS